jgi:hypothetical protein
MRIAMFDCRRRGRRGSVPAAGELFGRGYDLPRPRPRRRRPARAHHGSHRRPRCRCYPGAGPSVQRVAVLAAEVVASVVAKHRAHHKSDLPRANPDAVRGTRADGTGVTEEVPVKHMAHLLARDPLDAQPVEP